MRLDYGTQLSPLPIELSVGTLVKPKLSAIAKLSFERFSHFEFLIKMSPETYYKELIGEDGVAYWNSLSEAEKDRISTYDIATSDESMVHTFVEILNFFFVETVIYHEGYFVILNAQSDIEEGFVEEDIKGVISRDSFPQILDLLQQLCCIHEESEDSNMKFKNALAEKLYKKMRKAAKDRENKKQSDKNLALPNIISAVANNHPTINPINVWDLTVFQLIDSFERLRTKSFFDIDSTRVSVWGDESKTFDAALWYKNEYDKSGQPT